MIFILILLILMVVALFSIFQKDDYDQTVKESLAAEMFIKDHLYDSEGLIKTDLLSQSDVYLSESTGLWMEYLVYKNDRDEFNKQFQTLSKHFIAENSLIPWRIVENRQAEANALIDDLRIAKALFQAGEAWNEKKFNRLAEDISVSIEQYNMLGDHFIDHVDIKHHVNGDYLTLSYLDPEAIDILYEKELLSASQYNTNRNVLLNAPTSSTGFFPKTYYPEGNRYEFDQEVNLIDQYYVGYHRALWGGEVGALVQFTKESLSRHRGVLYGRLSNKSGKPTVDYEGASVYGLAILMCLEVKEYDLARQLYTEMKKFQVTDESSDYNGGYVDPDTLKTHSFDNLIPLIAERRGLDEGIYQ